MYIDSHCDTIKECYKKKISISDQNLSFNIKDARTPMIQMLAIYIAPEEAKKGFQIAQNVIQKFEEEKNKFPNKIVQIYSKNDIKKIQDNIIGVILTTENGSVIQSDLSNIDKLYNKGVRMMSIVWNKSNDLATGALEENDQGLTELGTKFIKYLNKKNILIDVSHSSEKTFWDIANISNKPIVASHSCVYNLCNHKRNLKDSQIKQITKMNGIIGVTFCSEFLNQNKTATVEDVAEHINYIKNLVGIDYVGIGSDFDGIDKEHMIKDLQGIKDIDNIIIELKKKNFKEYEIDKVLGGNWLRILEENL